MSNTFEAFWEDDGCRLVGAWDDGGKTYAQFVWKAAERRGLERALSAEPLPECDGEGEWGDGWEDRGNAIRAIK